MAPKSNCHFYKDPDDIGKQNHRYIEQSSKQLLAGGTRAIISEPLKPGKRTDTYLHFLDDLGDLPLALEVLLEELLAAEVAAPDVVDGEGGVELVEELAEDVLVDVALVHAVRHLLKHTEEHLRRNPNC